MEYKTVFHPKHIIVLNAKLALEAMILSCHGIAYFLKKHRIYF